MCHITEQADAWTNNCFLWTTIDTNGDLRKQGFIVWQVSEYNTVFYVTCVVDTTVNIINWWIWFNSRLLLIIKCIIGIKCSLHSDISTLQEVITGFLYSLLVLAFFNPILDQIDTFYMTDHYAPLVIIISHVAFGLVAFSLDSWSTSRGDTAQSLGTGAGAALATYVNYQLGILSDPPASSLPLTFPPLSVSLVALSLLRFLLGVVVLLLTRTVMKAVTIPFLCGLFGLPADDVRRARQHMKVELPYRYIVYSVVGFNCVSVVPLIFRVFHLIWVLCSNCHCTADTVHL